MGEIGKKMPENVENNIETKRSRQFTIIFLSKHFDFYLNIALFLLKKLVITVTMWNNQVSILTKQYTSFYTIFYKLFVYESQSNYVILPYSKFWFDKPLYCTMSRIPQIITQNDNVNKLQTGGSRLSRTVKDL